MAFTNDEEAAIRQALFGSGGQINELPVAENLEGAQIEVQVPAGESKRVNLISAVSTLSRSYAGRVWDESLSTPTGEAWGNIDLLRELPALLGLGCYLVADDRTRRKLDPTDHHRFADGSPAALDGSMGQYMWCWNAHHFGFRKDNAGKYYEVVSLSPLGAEWESYYVPAGGISALSGGVFDRLATGGAGSPRLCSLISDLPRYRGGNNQAAFDGQYNSQLGTVATSTTVLNFFRYARERGALWGAGWYVAQAVPKYLFRIIMGTRNCQAALNPDKDANGLYQGGLGAGVTNFGNWAEFSTSPFIKTSVGVELGDGVGVAPYEVKNSSGVVIYTAPVPVFFGLKNMFGHVWQMVGGVAVERKGDVFTMYIAPSMQGYANTLTDLTGMVKVGAIDVSAVSAQSAIKKLSMHKLCGLPTEVGGTSSTFYCDCLWKDVVPADGLYGYSTGAGANYGTSAGIHAFRAYMGPQSVGGHYTSPLCFFAEDPIVG